MICAFLHLLSFPVFIALMVGDGDNHTYKWNNQDE